MSQTGSVKRHRHINAVVQGCPCDMRLMQCTPRFTELLFSGTQSLKRRASSQALVHNPHLSRSMGAIAVPQSLTASQLVSSHELTFTVPTDRRAFARESTTDLGPSGESSTGSRRVSTLDNAPGVLASAVSEVEQQQMEVSPAHRCATEFAAAGVACWYVSTCVGICSKSCTCSAQQCWSIMAMCDTAVAPAQPRAGVGVTRVLLKGATGCTYSTQSIGGVFGINVRHHA